MEWYFYVAIISAGFVAGFINTLAGSGSLVSLPLLMFLGLPANIANGTNRIAILLQNVVAVGSFKQQKVLHFKNGIWLAVPAVIGSLVGSVLAVDLNEDIMEKTIGALLIFMFFVILFKPSAWIKGQAGLVRAKPGFWQIVIFFIIGVYGGFIQAGVGIFLLAGLVLGAGFDLVKANAIKMLIVLIYTPFALAVFMWNQQVDYILGFTLAIGNMTGAFVATKVAVDKGAVFVRYVLLIVIFGASLKLIGFYNWIIGLF